MNAQPIRTLLLDPLLQSWTMNGLYANALVEGLDESHKIAQPPGEFTRPVNHPAWILAHLNCYHDLIAGLLRGETPADPISSPFGRGSEVLLDADAYPPLDRLVADFDAGHDAVAAALRETDASILQSEMPVERLRERFPQVGVILPYLVVRHEALHLGQLSTWRRTMGLPATSMS